MHATLTIGQVARRAGVRADTVRYYERRGLIPRPRRTAAGYRDFPDATIQQIRFIKRAQELGFTLEEIADLLAVRVRSRSQCAGAMRIARHKIELIDAKLADLKAIRRALERLVASCMQNKSIVECPLLESLERNRRGETVIRS
jgi:MerR family mercuric resistance operon transcriptional regulator